ncbi:GNAT family N-acetyltransferase [Streptomyces lanatus]|uniref:Lysine N-acyltransferase MbtK n=1 Tax=Streptomyces lanatus TaxID=66900 RepID=A0ABV1Y3F5_9ACTN|nr:GNAT family N-acetyltransferase [Streptomyces lanatus]GHH26856.1 N-acetyltransferase [Streptomyces lanatus]
MPPTDATANAGFAPGTEIGIKTSPSAREDRGHAARHPAADAGADIEDTLDLRLPDEFRAFFANDIGTEPSGTASSGAEHAGAEDTGIGAERSLNTGIGVPASAVPKDTDLLGEVADWGPVSTSAGVLHLVPVRIERDLSIISRWMNDPAVTAFWGLAGSQNATEEHLHSQLHGDGRSVPCMGLLEGTPMSYWEIYRADLDPLARHYPARPHDIGVHLLIGGLGDRGRGLGGTLLRAVADLALDNRPACARIVAEPDIRNTPSVAAFLTAGFRFSVEIELPVKRAALMIKDRSLRHLL